MISYFWPYVKLYLSSQVLKDCVIIEKFSHAIDTETTLWYTIHCVKRITLQYSEASMFEKDIHVAELIDVYGSLLSERRRRIIEDYYYDDLSLSEIADNTDISRQGVRDSIKKSEAELRTFEEKLRLCERMHVFAVETDRLAQQIEAVCDALPSSFEDSGAVQRLRQIASELREKSL